MTPSASPTTTAELAERFGALHVPGTPLLMPNPWDIGSAKLFASLGFEALATTSGGFAASRGRLDGAMSRDEVLDHCAELAAAVDVPVSADLENCFADDPAGVALTITAAIDAGLAGGSLEDLTAAATTRSTSWRRPPSTCAPPPRLPTPVPSPSCSPPGRRTTCTGTWTWPTPSRACRPTRRLAPTSSSRRGSSTPKRCGPSWPPSTGP